MSVPDPRVLSLISPTILSLDAAMRAVADPRAGGVATFVGTARATSSMHAEREVIRLEYEAYVPMAESLLDSIARAELRDHAIERIALMHRIGVVAIGEASIIVAVSAPHRAAAFDACRHAVEQVKSRLPVWKKEVYADGTEWVGTGA